MNWWLKCIKNYVTFEGRARRKEYWMFYLFNVLFAAIAGFLDGIFGLTLLSIIYPLITFIPGLSVSIRRLHDVGKSGWMYLIILIPVIGAIWLLVLLCTDGQSGSNQWGDNPKEY